MIYSESCEPFDQNPYKEFAIILSKALIKKCSSHFIPILGMKFKDSRFSMKREGLLFKKNSSTMLRTAN